MKHKITRGGSFANFDIYGVRCASRTDNPPSTRLNLIGFRTVTKNSNTVLRGGSFRSNVIGVRCAGRYVWIYPDDQFVWVGFRVVTIKKP